MRSAALDLDPPVTWTRKQGSVAWTTELSLVPLFAPRGHWRRWRELIERRQLWWLPEDTLRRWHRRWLRARIRRQQDTLIEQMVQAINAQLSA